ncbi:MAG: hypothetical protein WC455_24160 [Dehalococcoidia bacterium]|jgi:hypothetical protein
MSGGYIKNITSIDQTPGNLSTAFESMVNNYNTAYNEAKTANEQRYQQMLNLANQTTQQRAADTRSAYGKQRSNALQGLARLGMSNTTVAPTMSMGIEREKQSALNRVADDMQQTKLGIMQSKTDAYPDASSLQSLLTALGSQYGSDSSGMSSLLQSLANMNY